MRGGQAIWGWLPLPPLNLAKGWLGYPHYAGMGHRTTHVSHGGGRNHPKLIGLRVVEPPSFGESRDGLAKVDSSAILHSFVNF